MVVNTNLEGMPMLNFRKNKFELKLNIKDTVKINKIDKKVFKDMFENIKYFITHLNKLGHLLRNTKISTRLIVSFIILSFIPLLITGIISYSKSSSAIRSKIDSSSIEIMQHISNNLKIEMEKLEELTTNIAFDESIQKGVANIKDSDILSSLEARNKISTMLTVKLSQQNSVKGVIFHLDSQSPISYASSDLSKEDMDQVISVSRKNNGSVLWTPVKNFIVISRAVRSTVSGTDLGVLVILIDQQHFTKSYESQDREQSSERMIMNSEGIVISSKNRELLSKEYPEKTLISEIKDNEEENKLLFERKSANGHNLISYSKVGKYDWYIIETISMDYINGASREIGFTIVMIALFCLLLAILFSYIISMSIAIPLGRLVNLIKEAKGGNLSVSIVDKSRDEIGEVTTNFNEMVGNIRALISSVQVSAKRVLTSSEKITFSADRSFTATEQIATTIQQIAKGASEQAQDTSEGVNYMNDLSTSINKVGSDIDQVSRVVTNTKKLSEEALVSVKSLNDKAAQTSSASEKIVNDINNLNNDMKEIKKIVKVIVGIAEQTNLLSLNAAIEAARAGEAGRGFAVVSDEVKKLSEQSKEASITINNIINSIQQKTELTVDAANYAGSTIKQQMDAVKDTDSAFKTIYTAMDGITSQIQNISASVKDIVVAKEKAVEIIESISAVSEEAAATSEEVSASTTEQIAGTEELSNLAKDLNEMAEELKKAISKFQI